MKQKKFKTGLVTGNREKAEFEAVQRKLREEHKINAPAGVVVVEKRNVLRYLTSAIRIICTIALFILAAIGATALLDSGCREALMSVFRNLQNQIGL